MNAPESPAGARLEAPPAAYTDADPQAAWLDELVLAYHALDLDGQGSGVAGHLSARAPGAQTFWSHRFGTTFAEMNRGELLESDFELKVLRGTPPINPTMHIHTRIYVGRPDVNAIVHTHGANTLALSAIGASLEMCAQPVAMFHDDLAVLDEYEGIALRKDEGETICEALAGRHALILAGHGLLTVGATVGEAAFRAIRLEAGAALQLAAMAAGTLRRLPEAGLASARQFSLKVLPMQWAAILRDTRRHRPWALGPMD